MKNKFPSVLNLTWVLAVEWGLLANAACQAYTGDLAELEYRAQTKRILLSLIDLERFTLKYRVASAGHDTTKRLRYFLTQETGAACGLAYEIATVKELRNGRKRPLEIDPGVLRKGFKSAMVGSIVAGSGSAFELTANTVLAIKNRTNGYDSRTANEHMASGLKSLDQNLTERETLVSHHKDHEFYNLAVMESKVLRLLRDGVASEYIQFNRDVREYRASENVFYAMNAGTNVVAAISAHYGIKGLQDIQSFGPANVLATVSGALTIASPLVSYAAGKVTAKAVSGKLQRRLGSEQTFDYAALRASQKEFSDALDRVNRSEVGDAIFRAGSYLEASQRSKRLMASELRLMHYLDQVAVENAVLGPAIGGTLLGQGIAGTVGFYRYNPSRKELDLFYKGAVAGTVGTSMAVGFTALGLVADWAYEHKLAKRKLLPRQMIEERLKHIDEVEAKISMM